MAPRDITAGKDYAEAIIDAIESSKIMVVVFSDSANNSKHVRNEVERAFNHQLPIIPFKTKDIIPAQSFQYFLSSTHWLDAINGNAEDYFEQLYRNCAALLNKKPGEVSGGQTGLKMKKSVEEKKVYIAFAAATVIAALVLFIAFNNGGKNRREANSGDTTAHTKIIRKADSIKQDKVLPATISPVNQEPRHSTIKTPSTELSSFNGAIYKDLSTNYSLTFETSGNKLAFSGNMYGYEVNGKLTYISNMHFKVSAGNVKGSISFVANNNRAIGNIIISSSGLPCTVDLTKVNEQ